MATQKKASKEEEAFWKGGNTLSYFGDVKAEFKKITWTDKEELKLYTKIVVAATFVFGLGIYGMDLVIQTSLDGLRVLVQLLTG